MTTTDTLNHETPVTPSTTQVAEPVEASASAEKPPRPTRKRPYDPSRCHYRYANGRRCTLPGLPSKSGLCLRHYSRQVAAGLPLTPMPDDFSDLSNDLLPEGTRFSSSSDLRNFLTRLLWLMTEGRVSPRRASVLAYIVNQLLHTHSVVLKEEKDLDNNAQEFIFGLSSPETPEDTRTVDAATGKTP